MFVIALMKQGQTTSEARRRRASVRTFSVRVRCSGTTALAPGLAHNSFMLRVIV